MPYTGVSTLFQGLVANTQLKPEHYVDASGKHGRVRSVLNSAYYGIDSETANSMLVGGYGKNTAVAPPSDIDLLFCLPDDVYHRFIQRTGNIQSQLLQEVRGVLQNRWPNTNISADGQIVLVPFSTYSIEVLPAFMLATGRYLHADTNIGGRWRMTDPEAEKNALIASNAVTKGKTIHLVKLAKAWKNTRNIHIKSLVLELATTQFLTNWQYSNTDSYGYYDWMVRDFFPYLVSLKNRYLIIPGVSDMVYSGDAWEAQARTAANVAAQAVEDGAADRILSAKSEWYKIFGSYLPT